MVTLKELSDELAALYKEKEQALLEEKLNRKLADKARIACAKLESKIEYLAVHGPASDLKAVTLDYAVKYSEQVNYHDNATECRRRWHRACESISSLNLKLAALARGKEE